MIDSKFSIVLIVCTMYVHSVLFTGKTTLFDERNVGDSMLLDGSIIAELYTHFE